MTPPFAPVIAGPLGRSLGPIWKVFALIEMANELAFFAVGIYGRELPKQHGAPLRMVLPWKYGFKGAKSIVKIEFLRSATSDLLEYS
ncbi:MAG: molybdopterin-dependent oxidoreductase [Thermosynechococcaceae cyanobacterium]